MAKEAIGILGGTLDPVHMGHLAMAKAAMRTAGLQSVMLLPSGMPPHKTGVTPAEHRWRKLCAAAAPTPELQPSRIELDRQGTIYTVDTLKELRAGHPKAALYYIIGADTLMELHNWRSYEEVLKLCTFLVCPRSGSALPSAYMQERRRLEGLGGRFMTVVTEPVDVSSTEIREALRADAPTPMLPVVCREYAGLAGLYGTEARLPHAEEWLAALFDALTVKRFAHTLAVAYTARSLARAHGVDEHKAEIAAALHDCAKCLPADEMRRICKERGLTDDPDILASGALMHSLVGASLAETDYGVTDREILDAIASHTTGRPGMTDLEMVVFLADKAEPTRVRYASLDKVRMLAPLSLKRAMIVSMEGTRDYVKNGGKPLHPQSLQTLAWLKETVGKS